MFDKNLLGSIQLPTGGYNAARVAIDPNDPDYLKKLALVHAVEGEHELNAPNLQPKPEAAPTKPESKGPIAAGILGKIQAPQALILPPETRQGVLADSDIDGSNYLHPQPRLAMKPAPAGDAPTLTAGPASPASEPLGSIVRSASGPITVQKPDAQQQEPAVLGLMHKAEGIHNKPLRILGEIGSGLLTGGEALGESMFPSVAAKIPGTFVNTALGREAQLQREALNTRQTEAEANLLSKQIEQYKAEHPNLTVHYTEPDANGEMTMFASDPSSGKVVHQEQFQVGPKATAEKIGFYQTPDGKVVRAYQKGSQLLTVGSNEPLPENAVPYAKPAAGHPVAGTVSGKPVFGLYDDKKGWLDAETKKPLTNFEPTPNYGQEVMPSKTITTLVGGVPTVMGWNPTTQRYDVPQGTSAAGALGHEMGQAGIIQRDSQSLIGEINQNRNEVGNVEAIVKSAFLNTPLADSTQAYLAARLASFAALNPAMHGFRGQGALEQFEKIVGGIPKSPDALIRSIQAIQKTAEDVNPTLPSSKSTAKPKQDPFSRFGGRRD